MTEVIYKLPSGKETKSFSTATGEGFFKTEYRRVSNEPVKFNPLAWEAIRNKK